MRPTTYLVGFLAAATAILATPDISGLPQEIQDCIIGNHHTGVDWMGKYHWESLSDEKFCKIDNKWATWMDDKCGGHNIGKGAQGKMCKRQP
ncbi:hypothetical protein D6C97_09836 [Aureobasidium pullulans]|uniref:Uncharacterized protein n=1 Tax=Aureobasidium pullulans EXF-150 TaxID=1043002 RepID=A0A074Y8U9_AURPU|nr:uncharacterized protein M438DRAFT_335913 [Aureobasidium pullulans EXF-150]KEQ83291.1 hypothetical protein M438DRAFT_335913 [Aureobasidium pullulans EXF-150]THY41472.1 hypothetical protein D6C97_09836 [Aureobasidium pullulans]